MLFLRTFFVHFSIAFVIRNSNNVNRNEYTVTEKYTLVFLFINKIIIMLHTHVYIYIYIYCSEL